MRSFGRLWEAVKMLESIKLYSSIVPFYQDLLGYSPEQTSLQQISESQWNKFATQRGLNPNSFGIYLPRNQTAIIKDDNPLSLFHEYFGHGLYCEQSLIGRKLVELEKRLFEKEKQEFQENMFTLEDIQRFRHQSQTFKKLEEFRQINLGKYELFAIWTEYLLSEEHGLRDNFGRKYDFLQDEDKKAIDSIINCSERYGNLAIFYDSGLAKRTTPERVKRLLTDIYKDKLQDIRFALLYGSKKEFSDIDVFMVGDNLLEIDSWLDVRIYSPKDFERKLNLFDIAVTNPLMTGEFILGDRNYFEQLKEITLSQQITEESIKHNIIEGANQKQLAQDYPENSRDNLRGLRYSLTYLANALALGSGMRLFKRDDILSYLQRQVPAEGNKPLRLQGGIKNAT